MQKIKQEGILIHEVSGDYKNFGRDTLITGSVTFVIMVVIGLIVQIEWLLSVLAGFLAVGSVLLDTIFFKQLFKFSFNDKEQNVRISYSRGIIEREIKINYTDLHYALSSEHIGKGEGFAKELKLYENEKLLLKVNKKKYGWTDGLVQEVIRSLKFRNIKRKIRS